MEAIQIAIVGLSEINEVLAYVSKARSLLFPMLDKHNLPADLLHFKTTYIDDERAVFLTARDGEGRIVAAIGMLPYDGRFSFLTLACLGTVEVVRLYVEPAYRRRGLATALFNTLVQLARERAIQTCYLHTHPFLPGAVDFWKRCGFSVLAEKKHGEFDTIHMAQSCEEYG